ncbi:HipA family kinase [Granulicella sp. S190]|uniref:HipA family kinase n=1 Tax=Granulicella sp. S190 TaxID=1747226 RepID=UPI00131C86CF|nr:HipA family kinase [Granulicella sp. S190]
MGLVEFSSFEDSLHPCCNAILSANQYVRKMKGGSQSMLVRANDGRNYVVKMSDNPIGPNLLANEHVGSLVAKAVGLPVAEAKGIWLSDSFIDSHPDLWFELPSGVRRPNKGMHFGSLLVGQTSGADRPTEYISPSRVSMITNRQAFLGMYLLDVWANHQDNRQAIFRRSSTNAQEVCFIDHGHMFGGPEWNFQGNLGSALHLEMAVYTDLWQDEQVASWISRFQTIIPEVLTSIVAPMPSEWYSGNLRELLSNLADRLLRLPELVQADSEKTWHPSQQKSIDEYLRVSDFGIHDLRTPGTRSAFRHSRATA